MTLRRHCGIHGQLPPESPQKTSHSSPVRARYGVCFVGSDPDLYSASVTAVMYAILCYIGPHYNGSQLYIIFIHICIHVFLFSCRDHEGSRFKAWALNWTSLKGTKLQKQTTMKINDGEPSSCSEQIMPHGGSHFR